MNYRNPLARLVSPKNDPLLAKKSCAIRLNALHESPMLAFFPCAIHVSGEAGSGILRYSANLAEQLLKKSHILHMDISMADLKAILYALQMYNFSLAEKDYENNHDSDLIPLAVYVEKSDGTIFNSLTAKEGEATAKFHYDSIDREKEDNESASVLLFSVDRKSTFLQDLIDSRIEASSSINEAFFGLTKSSLQSRLSYISLKSFTELKPIKDDEMQKLCLFYCNRINVMSFQIGGNVVTGRFPWDHIIRPSPVNPGESIVVSKTCQDSRVMLYWPQKGKAKIKR